MKALTDLHSQKILHFNLKPSNVLLKKTADNNKFVRILLMKKIVLSDYNMLSRSDDTGNVNFVNIEHLSPEMIYDEKDGLASEVWAVGTVLYFMLTGKMPFSK